MKLLEMKLFNLPSEHVPAVIGEVLKAEYMLVWAYHDADNVREFAIRVSRLRRHCSSVYAMPEKFENAALFLRLCLPSSQIRHESGVSKTLFKPEEFKNTGFSFSCGREAF